MKIAFYSPLKSPNHPVPSGDRLMARLLMKAMAMGGHDVSVVSELRSFTKQPDDPNQDAIVEAARQESEALATQWCRDGKPDLWFCYHPYYKAPDLLGPKLCEEFGIPYVTVEASYAPKRNAMGWQAVQDELLTTLEMAVVNICFTERDRDGLADASSSIHTTMLPPFIEADPFLENAPAPTTGKMITVAMMRAGDKLGSYQALANALALLPNNLHWTLDIVGDGPERATVEAMFSRFDRGRLVWHGQKTASEIALLHSRAALYVWPGHGEAYGLAYLEAQAAGLPVVAERIAGVPEVVKSGSTGILTPAGATTAYAQAIESLLTDESQRRQLSASARRFVMEERTLATAAERLNHILLQVKAPES
ncbi:glycosyltransferase family 4 protein [Agrobacterium tumefaciens]|uniref:glycosyltransferase family 4 protein n=1 Tax=Agrobacterium tumefaciens TaxID=358 RepID=UPI00287EB505|nr:glycosyltransferase family 4 protein [Agrobacterium tumefaciens]MDS7598010.1 glycosyltransferase family 4 protein [Agrobacterium tumefaciens]